MVEKMRCIYSDNQTAAMNKTELGISLESNSIPKEAYCLDGGLPNEAYCLNYENGIWEVYYSKRGRKSGLKIFNNEHDACSYIFRLLVTDGCSI